MSVGIVRYPGSNCDFDTLKYFDNSFFIWHKENKIPDNLKLLIIPGGFSFGDRLYNKATDTYTISPGTMALKSPISNIIKDAVKNNIPILGICNGFQILIQMGLLPGKLIKNEEEKFVCKKILCEFKYTLDENRQIYDTNLYIANSYGKYIISENEYNHLLENNQILVRYKSKVPEINSNFEIAGVCNKERNIFGMMPHPERNNNDLKKILNNILFSKENYIKTQDIFDDNIKILMESERISYKSTKKYLKTMYTKNSNIIQGHGENAGIIDIGGGYCITLRIESHNHPTFINPLEGAAAGVGGILRDIFTMGSRPIALLDFLRFGTDENSKNLLSKSIDGISFYGNCVGVPIVGGDCNFHDSYNKNPLINIACLGIMKKENIIYGNATNNNQLLIYVGSKTGNEGIGGAAMASNSFDNNFNKDELEKNVQKSDPFLEKLLLEACCEIAEKKLAIGMQDIGAGGLLCASQEVLKRGNQKTSKKLGCNIYLDKIPIKYDMKPIDILISESQERMFIVCESENQHKIFDIFRKWDLEYSLIGETTENGLYTIYDNNIILYNKPLDYNFDLKQEWDDNIYQDIDNNYSSNNLQFWKQYDYTIGNRTLKGPDMPGKYSILDIYEINKKLVITWGESFMECYNKMIELKAKPLSMVNCLNFGHPKDCIGNLKKVVFELNELCEKYNIPIVGGNVSLYNSTNEESIRPTPILLMIGIL